MYVLPENNYHYRRYQCPPYPALSHSYPSWHTPEYFNPALFDEISYIPHAWDNSQLIHSIIIPPLTAPIISSPPMAAREYLPPSRPAVSCEACVLSSTPCTVSIPKGWFKQTQCDSCLLNGDICRFIPPFVGVVPLKLSKNCSCCQTAHQVCQRSPSDRQCGRCIKMKLKCMFLPTSQGSRHDIIASRWVIGVWLDDMTGRHNWRQVSFES